MASYALDQPICSFTECGSGRQYPWTLADAFEGTQVFGATGSGKTSGSGRHIALGMLRAGFGGLVLAAKQNVVLDWNSWAREVKQQGGPDRTSDFVVVNPEQPYRFNFLEYENREEGGANLTYNLVAVFMAALESGKHRQESHEPYWSDAVRQLITNAIDLVVVANQPEGESGGRGSLSLSAIADVIRTAPSSIAEAYSQDWRQQSVCGQLISRAAKVARGHVARRDLAETISYWTRDFAGLAERTRSVVLSTFTSQATAILRYPFHDLLCNEGAKNHPTFEPDETFRGKIIILDLPVKTFGEAGRFGQILYKTVWQRATERRLAKLRTDSPHYDTKQRPVFLWADESQYFVTDHDMLFQQTARDAQAATVYLTQNISNYYAVLSGRGGNAATDSLLGNLQTKIFHANGDPATNEWAERLFAKQARPRGSNTRIPSGYAPEQWHESLEPVVPMKAFTTLRKGGTSGDRVVEGLIFLAGTGWHSRTDPQNPQDLENRPNALLARFQQSMRGS